MSAPMWVVREARDVIEIVNRLGAAGRKSKLVIIIALGCTFLDGYDFGALGVGATQVQTQLDLSAGMFGTTTAAIAIGALIGALVGGYYVDKIGRIRMLSLDGVFFVVAAIGAAVATNVYWLISCRFVMGLGVGLDFPVALSFIAEFKGRKRGAALTGWGVMFSAGLVMTYVVAIVAHALGAGDHMWRIVLGLGALPGLVVILGRYFWLQESPMWAASRGDLHGAAEILRRSYGANVQVDAAVVQATRPQLRGYSLRDYAAVFRSPYLRRTALSSIIGLTQSMEFYAVSFYLPVLTVQLFGKSFYPSIVGAMLFAAVMPAGTLVTLKLVDHKSMRMLIALGYTGVACALIVLALGSQYLPLALIVFFICLFQFGHGFGPGTLGMTMAGMSFPTAFRGAGVGVSQAMLRVGSIIGFYFFPLVLAATSLGTTLLVVLSAPLLGLLATLVIRWEPVGRDVDAEASALAPSPAEELS